MEKVYFLKSLRLDHRNEKKNRLKTEGGVPIPNVATISYLGYFEPIRKTYNLDEITFAIDSIFAKRVLTYWENMVRQPEVISRIH